MCYNFFFERALMANITFVVDDEQLRQMKVIAAEHETSINALVRNYFAHLTASGLADAEAMNGNLQTLFDYSMGKCSRHQARKALGVDDATLTTLLRQTGFPPPRASTEQEDKMLEEIKDIHFG
jgi:hypothetical protein